MCQLSKDRNSELWDQVPILATPFEKKTLHRNPGFF